MKQPHARDVISGWRSGANTADIALVLRCSEADVANLLARHLDRMQGFAADRRATSARRSVARNHLGISTETNAKGVTLPAVRFGAAT